MRFARFLLVVLLMSPLASAQAWQDRPQNSEAEKKTPKTKEDEEFLELLKLFVDTLDQVDRNYVKDVSRRELMEAAIEGMLGKLDQHSNYISPAELAGFRRGMEGQFGGVGIRVSIENGYPTVASPLVGGPAYRAGLQAGDQILAVDGKPTKGVRSVDRAARMLKGKVGSEVALTIRRPAEKENASKEVLIKREVVRLPSVLGDRRKEDDSWDFLFDHQARIGYIRIDNFGRHTARELRAAMEELTKPQELAGLIIDLRYNPGGLLSAAIEVSDMFVERGVIVSTKGRNTPEKVWRAHVPETYTGFPMAVIVNQATASASEIVAACLQDHKRATIVGRRTWGKGSVQNIIELESGRSAVKLTTAGYHRPSGQNIHREDGAGPNEIWGVRPNKGLKVAHTFEQEQTFRRLRRRNDLLRKDEKGRLKHQRHIDPQLRCALDHISQRISNDKNAKYKDASPGGDRSPSSVKDKSKIGDR